MTDIVRVLRILEYTGEREFVERTLSKGAVPANGEYKFGSNCIRSAVLGQYPEILQQAQNDDDTAERRPG